MIDNQKCPKTQSSSLRDRIEIAIAVISMSLVSTTVIASAWMSHQEDMAEKTRIEALRKQKTKEAYSSWGLTQAEWAKFKELQQGERQYWSPNLDPLTLLGVEAETEEERMKYARLLAKKEYQRVEKELAFQRAYDKAFKELYPNETMFEPRKPQPVSAIEPETKRILFFAQAENCNNCASSWQRVENYRKTFKPNVPIDIYFVGKTNDKAIRLWATQNKIDNKLVKTKQITLNYDKKGYWAKYGQNKSLPMVFEVDSSGEWKELGGF